MLAFALSLGAATSPVIAQSRLSDPAALNEQAPNNYNVRFETSKGVFVIEVRRDAAPNGADRFYNLVKHGYYDDARFFRVVSGFVVQFGINGDPAVNAKWITATIKDDPVKTSNQRGFLTFATAGPDSRTTQVFINLGDNGRLDRLGFSPFGRVISGMGVVDKFYAEYGDGPPRGNGPDQSRIQREGNAYLKKDFPRLDYIRKATILQ
ncbi:MAG TPA: peptidylprolyl isomerase [Xanthobacteraceae bacterium]|nr:peptidylprolyl isomerase [Xanthobacteraceae bacterium]